MNGTPFAHDAQAPRRQVTVAQLQTALKAAQLENQGLRAQLAERDTLIAEQQTQLARYRETDALLRNYNKSHHTPAEKVIMPYVFQQLATSNDQKDGHVHICHQTAAKALGINQNTVGLALETAVQVGELTKVTEPRQNKDGVTYPAAFYKPVSEVLRIVHTRPKDELKQVRKLRYTCRECGSQNLTITHTVMCHHCHAVYDIHSERQQPDDTPEQDVPGDLQFVDHDAGGADLENVDVFKQEYPPISTYDPDAGGGDLQFVDHQEPAAPIVQRTDEEALRDAGALLQVNAPVHIKMLPDDPANKYIEVKHALSADDARAHFRGGPACGFKRQKDVPWTRWLIFDEDNADGAAKLERCARQLEQAGYLPILETSPAKDSHAGGAHLVMLYSGLVVTRAAYAHVYALAPELQTVKEHYPHAKNMRAPGGFYKRPGVSGWCTLLSVATGDRSSDGISNARLLLANMTPERIVPDLPAELPALEPERPPAPPLEHPAPAVAYSGLGPQFGPKDVIAWFNGNHTLDDIHPRKTATHALAIWRDDTVPSVHYNENGHWYDYGTDEHGDAFDLYWRVRGITKREALSEQAKLYRVFMLSQVA